MARITSSRDALRLGAEVIATKAKLLAGTFSSRIPEVIHVYTAANPNTVFVSAGHRGGKWGWEPIHAWMFEEEHNGREPKHPLFGDRKHWYYQPYRPYMEEAAEVSSQAAADRYADIDIAFMCKQAGFK